MFSPALPLIEYQSISLAISHQWFRWWFGAVMHLPESTESSLSTESSFFAWLILAWWRHMVMWSWFNIGSDNGLLPYGTRPLSEPMMTYHHWEKFYRKCLKWRKMKPLTLCTGLHVLDWMSSQYHDHFCYYAASPWCIFLLLYVVSGFVCGCPAVL